MELLPQPFYNRPVLEVAPDLLGKILVGRGGSSGIIVETEAYHQDDMASHSYGGKRKRNAVMYGPPGHGYVYFIYGMYWCFNCVCEPEDVGAGVLIRALEPLDNIELMQKRRGKERLIDLCSGPGKLTQALDIRYEDNGINLHDSKSPIRVYDNPNKYAGEIILGPRIGITKAAHEMWRFGTKDSKYLSKKF